MQTCDQCGNSFAGRTANAKRCSAECRRLWRRAYERARYPERYRAHKARYATPEKQARDRARVAGYRESGKLTEWHRTHTYGITPERFSEMLAAQAGACAICGDSMTKPHIDHHHETGAVRGLLCRGCNHGLGNFADDPRRLLAAVAYLGHDPVASPETRVSASGVSDARLAMLHTLPTHGRNQG